MLGNFRTGIPSDDKTDSLPPNLRSQLRRPAYWFFAIAAALGLATFIWIIATAR